MERQDEITIEKGLPGVFLLPDVPFWFVVGKEGEAILDGLRCLSRNTIIRRLKERGLSEDEATFETDHFLSCMTIPDISGYKGRKELHLNGLKELWFHLLDPCNLSCSHCLFSSQRRRARILERALIETAIKEAVPHGLALVCFTGGEPLMYPHFGSLLDYCTRVMGLDVAVLTNGTVAREFVKENPALMSERIHFQVSIDGPESIHDEIRGAGAFAKTRDGVSALLDHGFSVTASICINRATFPHLVDTLDAIKGMGITACHLMWHFDQGAGRGLMPPIDLETRTLFRRFLEGAEAAGIRIDNLDAIGAQLFSPPGTRFDLGNAGWESLCIGPDGTVWPTPAKVDAKGFSCGSISDGGPGIIEIWQTSDRLEAFRRMSLFDSHEMRQDPWRFILGGGDVDHAMRPRAQGDGFELLSDPNRAFYLEMIDHLIQMELHGLTGPKMHLGVRLKMGDVMGSCGEVNEVNFTHSNCLLSLGREEGRGLVREFYKRRATSVDESIRNPLMDSGLPGINFIPKKNIERSYGCGSPMADADVRPGEFVCDLGSGAGVECFLAAKEVGPNGRVFGVDMTDEMLALAESAKKGMVEEIGHENVFFIKAHLEDLPFKGERFHCITSNCVLNLTKNKRRVLTEALRALRPGGRIVISDVVTEREPVPWIRGNKTLVGECLGGALVEPYLFSMLRDLGFVDLKAIKRFPYREVQGHQFFSLTFEARKPAKQDVHGLGEIHLLKVKQTITRPKASSPCCSTIVNQSTTTLHQTGCLLCGGELQYMDEPVKETCAICGSIHETKVRCLNGHFCCDACHISAPLELIKKRCLHSSETDMIALMKEMRMLPGFPMHGPEHHAMVPGIIVTTYRNLGGEVSDQDILFAIENGAKMPGGACGYMGACGAAVGVGVGFSLILRASPLASKARALANRVVAEVLLKISERDAPRCCQRESYIALKEAARLSSIYLDRPLVAQEELVCSQFQKNKECIGVRCPIFPKAYMLTKGF